MNYTILVLLIYAVLMLLSTVLLTKKEKSVVGFCVGNRNTGWVVSALSIAATWIWAPALFTSTENAYTKGFAGLFWFLVPNVLCLILFIPFAKRIRKEMPEGITLSGYMHDKYRSESVKNVYLFQLGALSVLSTGVQLLAGSKILSLLTGMPFWCMIIIMAAIAYSYSQFSGIKASILTDSIQMIFMLEGRVPVVVVKHNEHSEDIYGTVTHNRARGTHLLEPMKAIVRELINEGKSVEEIGKQLGMRPEEIFRLSDFSKEDFLQMMIKPEQKFSKAEFITKI